MGGVGQHGLATVDADVTSGGSAQAMYTGIRKALALDNALSPLPDLGQGAYSYVDALTGPHVTAFDDNLHIIASLANLGVDPTVSNAQLITALAKVCQQTMDNLRA
jgi:hypothetical protein